MFQGETRPTFSWCGLFNRISFPEKFSRRQANDHTRQPRQNRWPISSTSGTPTEEACPPYNPMRMRPVVQQVTLRDGREHIEAAPSRAGNCFLELCSCSTDELITPTALRWSAVHISVRADRHEPLANLRVGFRRGGGPSLDVFDNPSSRHTLRLTQALQPGEGFLITVEVDAGGLFLVREPLAVRIEAFD